MYLASALLAGLLPWMMVHTGLAALAIGWLAMSGARSKRLWIGPWLAVAALPSISVVGAYALWGPFDTFVRTVFLAPIDFVTEGFAKGTSFFPDRGTSGASASPETLHYVFLLVAGLVLMPGLVRRASSGSPLRLSPYLVLPPTIPLILMAYIKSAAPEYWIDAAPAAALLVAAAAHRIFTLKAWDTLAGSRYLRPSILRGCLAIYVGLVLALLTGPENKTTEPPLPAAYCEGAAWWIKRLGPDRTVLDTSALCGYWMLLSDASLHPPFTFTDHWFRQLHMRWVGESLAGDGSESTAAGRLGAAIGPTSTAGIILADKRIYDELRKRRWHARFFRDLEAGLVPKHRWLWSGRSLLDARHLCSAGCVSREWFAVAIGSTRRGVAWLRLGNEGRRSTRDLSTSGHPAWRMRFGRLWTSGINALAFVVVPSLPYALLMTEYVLRPRTPLILLYWCVGVVAPKCPAWFVASAMAAVASLDLVWLVSGLFFLHPSWVVEALKYAPLMYPPRRGSIWLSEQAQWPRSSCRHTSFIGIGRVFSGGDYWVCALWRQPSLPICC